MPYSAKPKPAKTLHTLSFFPCYEVCSDWSDIGDLGTGPFDVCSILLDCEIVTQPRRKAKEFPRDRRPLSVLPFFLDLLRSPDCLVCLLWDGAWTVSRGRSRSRSPLLHSLGRLSPNLLVSRTVYPSTKVGPCLSRF